MENFSQRITKIKEILRGRISWSAAVAALAVSAFFLSFLWYSHPPQDFPTGTIVTVFPGKSLTSIAADLYRQHVITSPLLFRSTVILLGGEKRVIAGDYFLDHRESGEQLAYRIVHGSFHLEPVKVTIPEGWNIFQMNAYLQKRFPHFNTATFLTLAKPLEGYLFPDTYFFSPVVTEQEVVTRMKAEFDANIATVTALPTFGHSLREVITMASILEGEASSTESRRIIAGILWKRLSLGMPLQVDSSFMYVNGKNTYELTLADLKIESPYNTYIHTGLPPTPIANPGLDSISAAVTPIQTDYLYFFSSKTGMIYYAKTYDEHKKNIAKYGR